MNEDVNGASTEWNIGRKAGSFNESASNYIQMCSSATPQLSFFCISFLLPNSLAQQRLRAQTQLNHRKIQQSFVDLMATNAEIRLLNINVSSHTHTQMQVKNIMTTDRSKHQTPTQTAQLFKYTVCVYMYICKYIQTNMCAYMYICIVYVCVYICIYFYT